MDGAETEREMVQLLQRVQVNKTERKSMAKKQKELDSMPDQDESAAIAERVHEANKMISEGNESRVIAQEELAEFLIANKKSKVTILCEEDQCYRTFSLKKIKAQNKISVTKEKINT